MRTYYSIFLVGLIAFISFFPASGFCQSGPKPTCAVLTFRPDEASAQNYESRYITNRYADLLRELERYNVLSPADIEKQLAGERATGFPETCSEKSCAVEIGKELNADFVIYGLIGHIGDMFSLDTTIVNVANGSILNSSVTDIEGSREEFVTKAPPRNITSLLMLSQMPSEWRTQGGETVSPESAAPVPAPAAEPAEKMIEPAEKAEKPFKIGPRLGVGYGDDGIEIGIGLEARHNNLSLKVIGNDIGVAGAFSYYLQSVGNTPYASLVTAYYKDDPDGIDEEGILYGVLGGYRINVNENIDVCIGLGAGIIDWEQTERNPDTGEKDDGTDVIPIGELTFGYMF